jgi:hypothetical protein
MEDFGTNEILFRDFILQVDEAKRLLAYHTSIEVQNVPHKWYQGYLFPLMCAYAVGLLLANVAVVLMQQGQPALLYLVPCCLGTMAVVGRGELKEMWGGSKILRMADKLIRKCEKHWGQQRMQRALERHKRGQAAAMARDRGGSRRSIHDTGNGALQQRGRTSVREESEQNDKEAPPGADGRQPGRGRDGGAGRGRGGPRPDGTGGSEKRPRPAGEQGKPAGGGGPHDGLPPHRNSTGRRAPTRVGQLDAPNSPKKTPTGPRPESQKRSKVGQPDAPNSPKKTPTEKHMRPHAANNPQSAPPSGAATKTPHGKDPIKPAGKNPPTDEDVCFGKSGHPGNLEFNAIIQSTAKAMSDKEYDMSIYKSIRRQLKGRRLFKSTGPGAWAMANKDDAMDLVRDAFNEEKKKIAADL